MFTIIISSPFKCFRVCSGNLATKLRFPTSETWVESSGFARRFSFRQVGIATGFFLYTNFRFPKPGINSPVFCFSLRQSPSCATGPSSQHGIETSVLTRGFVFDPESWMAKQIEFYIFPQVRDACCAFSTSCLRDAVSVCLHTCR